jgi:hypothetical protein
VGYLWISEERWDDEIRALGHIREGVDKILSNQEKAMALQDDLNNAVTALATGFVALDASVQSVIAFIKTQPNLSPAVSAAIDSMGKVTAKMAQDAADLTAQIPGATTVTPTPAPAPAPTPTAKPVSIGDVPVTDPGATPPSTPPPAATSTVG